MNRTIGQIFHSLLLISDQSVWVAKVPFVEFGLNTTISASMVYTPYELVFGAKARLPVDIMLANPHTALSPLIFVQQCADLLSKARMAMLRAQSTQKAQYDLHHSASSFEIDELVLLSTLHLQLYGVRKLLPHWIGPFCIIEKFGTLSYRLKLPKIYNLLHPVFHVSKLKRYVLDGVKELDLTLPILTDKGLEYEVESIIA